MASIFKRTNSPYWWLRWREGGFLRRVSTKFPLTSTGKRLALLHASELTSRELSGAARIPGGQFNLWVLPYLRQRCQSPATLRRYVYAWLQVQEFLDQRGLRFPNQITREHAYLYLDSRKGARHNTACWEVRRWSSIMEEAVRRGYASRNPLFRMGQRHKAVKVRPELSDADLAIIQAAAETARKHRDFFVRSFGWGATRASGWGKPTSTQCRTC